MRKQSLRKAVNIYLQTTPSGSHELKKRRARVLHELIDHLFIVGSVPSTWKLFTPHHMQKVVTLWSKQKIKPATMMKRMTVIRAFLKRIGVEVSDFSNQALGIQRITSTSKKRCISLDVIEQIKDPIAQPLMGLQIHFGLTLRETMLFAPDIHVQQGSLWVTREIAFNSSDRIIPIRTTTQNTLLHMLGQMTTGKSLLATYGEEAIHLAWRNTLTPLKLPTRNTYRAFYAKQLQVLLSDSLSHYRLMQRIMEEMGIKSRTTLWHYLHES